MRIKIKVKTKAKKPRVEKVEAGEWIVFVKEAPEKGKANQAVIKTLAKHFKIGQSNVKIISGFSSKNKIIEVF